MPTWIHTWWHGSLELICAEIRGPIFPSKTEFRSGISMPVFTSCTNLYVWETYLLVSSCHKLTILSFLILFTVATPCSLAIVWSLAFNLLSAFILFAKLLLSPSQRQNKKWNVNQCNTNSKGLQFIYFLFERNRLGCYLLLSNEWQDCQG